MSQAADLVAQLETSHRYIRKMIAIFEEEDAGVRSQPELYTVAGHIAHAAIRLNGSWTAPSGKDGTWISKA